MKTKSYKKHMFFLLRYWLYFDNTVVYIDILYFMTNHKNKV